MYTTYKTYTYTSFCIGIVKDVLRLFFFCLRLGGGIICAYISMRVSVKKHITYVTRSGLYKKKNHFKSVKKNRT